MTDSFYSTPSTFLDLLLEHAQYIEQQRHDPSSTKEDVLDSMEKRVSFLMGKMVAHPISTSFRIIPEDPS
jgi:hypothetical protein